MVQVKVSVMQEGPDECQSRMQYLPRSLADLVKGGDGVWHSSSEEATEDTSSVSSSTFDSKIGPSNTVSTLSRPVIRDDPTLQRGRHLIVCFFLLSLVILLTGILTFTLTGQAGQAEAPTFTQQNSSIIPTMFPTTKYDHTMFPTTKYHQTEQPTIISQNTPTVALDSMENQSLLINLTSQPSFRPSKVPATSQQPTIRKPDPTPTPTTSKPTPTPTMPPTKPISYQPGNLTNFENGLLLSQGLRARLIAQTGQQVPYFNGINSTLIFHTRPDGGATFPDNRPYNQGGWIYVSNSEMRYEDGPGGKYNGGVGAITFDRYGRVRGYDMVLQNTTWNCGGGKTPWNTWVSCEEQPNGVIWQVSPDGSRTAQKVTMGSDGGRWESFAYDIRNGWKPRFFATFDHMKGHLIRWTPTNVDWGDPWGILHGNGTTEYLLLFPEDVDETHGTFRWTSDKEMARNNARRNYPNTEGIDSHDGILYFVSKRLKQLYELDLDKGTYVTSSTKQGLFQGKPDQLQRVMKGWNKSPIKGEEEILYFTEESGKDSGVHGRNKKGESFTLLESPLYDDEVTGLAFSPDGMHMYVAYQEEGVLFDIYRDDQRPFHAAPLNVKYHETE